MGICFSQSSQNGSSWYSEKARMEPFLWILEFPNEAWIWYREGRFGSTLEVDKAHSAHFDRWIERHLVSSQITMWSSGNPKKCHEPLRNWDIWMNSWFQRKWWFAPKHGDLRLFESQYRTSERFITKPTVPRSLSSLKLRSVVKGFTSVVTVTCAN